MSVKNDGYDSYERSYLLMMLMCLNQHRAATLSDKSRLTFKDCHDLNSCHDSKDCHDLQTHTNQRQAFNECLWLVRVRISFTAIFAVIHQADKSFDFLSSLFNLCEKILVLLKDDRNISTTYIRKLTEVLANCIKS